MKKIRNGLVALLTASTLLAPRLIENTIGDCTSAYIVGSEEINSNASYTLTREVRDIDNDGHPDVTLGYSICFRNIMTTASEPTEDEIVEFYEQKGKPTK